MAKTPKKLLFVADPLPSLKPNTDSTVELMRAACAGGWQVWAASYNDLELRQGHAVAWAVPVRVTGRLGAARLNWGERQVFEAAQAQAVFLRKDPPVNPDYLYGLYWAGLLPASVKIINRPEAIAANNEKVLAVKFARFMPPTVMTCDVPHLLTVLAEMGGRMVVKPLDGYAGRGVVLVEQSNPTHQSILENLTQFGSVPVVAQAFLPEIKKGDLRVLLWRGRVLGVISRVPKKGDIRSNMAMGGTPVPARVPRPIQAICDEIGPELNRQGLHFLGLDFIGRYLTEINFTSPTGLVSASQFAVQELARPMLGELAEAIL